MAYLLYVESAVYAAVCYIFSFLTVLLLISVSVNGYIIVSLYHIDYTGGSTLEAMALAVERSAVVLVCLSQGYKDSPSCRTGNRHNDILVTAHLVSSFFLFQPEKFHSSIFAYFWQEKKSPVLY